jgi:tRNA-binding EMAP/Myf-like protein
VDVGDETTRPVVAGVAAYYAPDALVGRLVLTPPHPHPNLHLPSAHRHPLSPPTAYPCHLLVLLTRLCLHNNFPRFLGRDYLHEHPPPSKVVVATNLKPASVRGVESLGMLLAASKQASDTSGAAPIVELLEPAAGAAVGERLSLEGDANKQSSSDLPDQVLKTEGQQKVWRRVAAKLAVDARGEAVFGGVRLLTSMGPCTASTLREVAVS